jgi:hypothetical protein
LKRPEYGSHSILHFFSKITGDLFYSFSIFHLENEGIRRSSSTKVLDSMSIYLLHEKNAGKYCSI